jgi:hypothetical protein
MHRTLIVLRTITRVVAAVLFLGGASLHLRRLDPVTGLVLPEWLKPAGMVLLLTGELLFYSAAECSVHQALSQPSVCRPGSRFCSSRSFYFSFCAGSGSKSTLIAFGTGYALRQNGRVSFTAGVGSAGEVFAALFVDFQIVGDILAVRTIANNQSIRWMAKAEVFHEILQCCEYVKVKQVQSASP